MPIAGILLRRRIKPLALLPLAFMRSCPGAFPVMSNALPLAACDRCSFACLQQDQVCRSEGSEAQAPACRTRLCSPTTSDPPLSRRHPQLVTGGRTAHHLLVHVTRPIRRLGLVLGHA